MIKPGIAYIIPIAAARRLYHALNGVFLPVVVLAVWVLANLIGVPFLTRELVVGE